MAKIIFDEEIREFSVVESQEFYSTEEEQAKAKRNRRLKIAAGIAAGTALTAAGVYGLNRYGKSKNSNVVNVTRIKPKEVNDATSMVRQKMQVGTKEYKNSYIKNLVKSGMSKGDAENSYKKHLDKITSKSHGGKIAAALSKARQAKANMGHSAENIGKRIGGFKDAAGKAAAADLGKERMEYAKKAKKMASSTLGGGSFDRSKYLALMKKWDEQHKNYSELQF